MFRLSTLPPPPSLLSRPTQHILYLRHLPAVCSQVWRLPDSPGVTHSWYYWAMWPGNPFHLWSVSERQSTAGCRLYSSRLYRLYSRLYWLGGSRTNLQVGLCCSYDVSQVSLPRAPTSFWRKDLNIHLEEECRESWLVIQTVDDLIPVGSWGRVFCPAWCL